MARSVATIQNQIIAAKNANPDIASMSSVNPLAIWSASRRAMWLSWTYIIAVCQAILEQLMDNYVSEIETLVAQSAAASTLWVQAKIFAFQWSATNPQVVQLIDTIPQFPTVDPSLQIITACSVTPGVDATVNIKVATGNPYTALSGPQISAAQAYITTIGDARTTYNVISLNPDRLYIVPLIYYQGQYSAVIQNNVITAISNYLQNLSQVNFDGSLKMSDLEAVIRNITGVNDVVLMTVSGRAATDNPPPAVINPLISNSAVVNRLFHPAAGYMIPEDTPGYTLSDVLIPGSIVNGVITPANATLIAQ